MLKKSLWVRYKILGLFVNPLTADNMYSPLNRDFIATFSYVSYAIISQTKNILSIFFFTFSKFRFNFEHFQKKMTLIADVFLKLRTPKNVVR